MPADKAMILGKIAAHHGSAAAFNDALKLQLLLNPLSYRVDLDQLSRRSQRMVWDFGPVLEWLDDPEGARVLCVEAGAGTGKSTVSAALVREVLGRRTEGGGWEGPATALHFLKHNDARRLDPVRIVESLAFQLGLRLPDLRERLFALDGAAVASLRKDEEAFQLLLGKSARVKNDESGSWDGSVNDTEEDFEVNDTEDDSGAFKTCDQLPLMLSVLLAPS
jgi:hypothetical protein